MYFSRNNMPNSECTGAIKGCAAERYTKKRSRKSAVEKQPHKKKKKLLLAIKEKDNTAIQSLNVIFLLQTSKTNVLNACIQ